ncbi:hypothetical protein OG21DRAFT_1491226 [Imleria badia]|nr:hypothetical protein OG21DRAFT_1491226 [Imleria badia]
MTKFVPRPLHTFNIGSTAFRINYDASLRRVAIDDVATMFGLPDLRAALGNYVRHEGEFSQNFHKFGPRRSAEDVQLPFRDLQIWYKGQYDFAIMNTDQEFVWPSSSLQGHSVVNVRLIMCPASPKGRVGPYSHRFLVYAQHFDIAPQGDSGVERTTGLHVLKRATRRISGVTSTLGDIFPLDQLRSYAHVVPRFGGVADNRLTSSNSVEYSESFFLNKYFNK